MNDEQIISLLGRVLAWCVGVVVALIAMITGWFTYRQNKLSDRQDAFDVRMNEFERRAVTDGQFRQALQELRDDRKAMHQENKAALAEIQRLSEAHLTRIEKKMDDYEVRDSHTRHGIANSVQVLMQQVATLEAHYERSRDERLREAEKRP